MIRQTFWKFGIGFLGFLCLTFFLGNAYAKPKRNPFVVFDLSLHLKETYDDNVFQVGAFEQSDFVTEITPGIGVEFQTIKYVRIGGSYRTHVFYYLNNSSLNDVFHQADLDVSLDFSKFAQWKNFRLGVEVDYDPVSISAVNSSGATFNTTQKFSGALVPGYRHQFSPTLDLDVEGRILTVFYVGEGADSYGGDLNAVLRKKLLKRIYFRVGGNAAYQKFNDLGDVIIFGGDVGLDIEFFKRLTGGVKGGYRIINLPQGGSNGAITLEANLKYLLSKRTNFLFLASRSNSVDLFGNDFLATSLSIEATHRLSMKTLLGLKGYYRQAEQSSFVSGLVLDDSLDTFGTQFKVQYTDRWTFGLGYEHNMNSGQNISNDFSQNRYWLEAAYHFPWKF